MAEAYDFTVLAPRPVDEVVGALHAALTKYGVHARWTADVAAGLRDLGADPGSEIILIEACEPEGAREALREEPRLAYLIPARLAVQRAQEGTLCGFLRPTELVRALDRPDLEPYADRLEKLLRDAVSEATALGADERPRRDAAWNSLVATSPTTEGATARTISPPRRSGMARAARQAGTRARRPANPRPPGPRWP